MHVVLEHNSRFLLLQSELTQDISEVAHVTPGCRCGIEFGFRRAESENCLSVGSPRCRTRPRSSCRCPESSLVEDVEES
eukprot:2804424-Rhodomonas_salina.1